jgi:hypothetical protein
MIPARGAFGSRSGPVLPAILNDHMMGRLQKNHPVWIPQSLIDRHVSGFSHCLEMNVMIIARVRLFTENETGIGSRHHGNEVTALAHVSSFL